MVSWACTCFAHGKEFPDRSLQLRFEGIDHGLALLLATQNGITNLCYAQRADEVADLEASFRAQYINTDYALAKPDAADWDMLERVYYNTHIVGNKPATWTHDYVIWKRRRELGRGLCAWRAWMAQIRQNARVALFKRDLMMVACQPKRLQQIGI